MLIADKRGVTLLSWRAGFISIKYNNSQVSKITVVVPGLDAPRSVTVFASKILAKLVIANDVDRVFVRRIEFVSEGLVFLVGEREITQLDQSVGFLGLHCC